MGGVAEPLHGAARRKYCLELPCFVHGKNGGGMYLYGLHVPGLQPVNALTGFRDLPWHEVALEQHVDGPPTSRGFSWSEGVMTYGASDDFCIQVTRHPRLSVRISAVREISAAELVHPVMVVVGAAVAWWTGRLSFHAAAVVMNGRAWVLLASPGGGKSTLATCLRGRGHAVLSDDLVVLDGRTVLAGPRSADLREGAVEHLTPADSEYLPWRKRWRAPLGPAPHEVPLGGFVVLEWGDAVETRPADAAERLRALARFDGLLRGPVTPTDFLDLVDVPSYVVRRPPEWSALDATVSSLEELAATVVHGEPGVLREHQGMERRGGLAPGGEEPIGVEEFGDLGR
jgi:hypothetical protein